MVGGHYALERTDLMGGFWIEEVDVFGKIALNPDLFGMAVVVLDFNNIAVVGHVEDEETTEFRIDEDS